MRESIQFKLKQLRIILQKRHLSLLWFVSYWHCVVILLIVAVQYLRQQWNMKWLPDFGPVWYLGIAFDLVSLLLIMASFLGRKENIVGLPMVGWVCYAMASITSRDPLFLQIPGILPRILEFLLLSVFHCLLQYAIPMAFYRFFPKR